MLGVMSITVLSSTATIRKAVVKMLSLSGESTYSWSKHWTMYSDPKLSTGNTKEASNE